MVVRTWRIWFSLTFPGFPWSKLRNFPDFFVEFSCLFIRRFLKVWILSPQEYARMKDFWLFCVQLFFTSRMYQKKVSWFYVPFFTMVGEKFVFLPLKCIRMKEFWWFYVYVQLFTMVEENFVFFTSRMLKNKGILIILCLNLHHGWRKFCNFHL